MILNNIENHMVIGSPDPPDGSDMDITDWRLNKADGCEFLFKGECHGEDCGDYYYGDMCCMMETCPGGRW